MSHNSKALLIALIISAVITLVYIFMGFGFIKLVIEALRDCWICP